MVSCCTVCMGRLHHIKETLPRNLKSHLNWHGEFVLLDYNSQDGLREWVETNLEDEIMSGRLTYYRTEDPQNFHMAHAKNVAHRVAKNEVVCNLDADNYVDAEFSQYLTDLFKKHPNSITRGFGEHGFFGRVAVLKEHFERLRGYDEDFEGWGYDDEDLVLRGQAMGLSIHDLPPQFAKVICHPRQDRWESTRERNVQLSTANAAAGVIEVNRERRWGTARLTNHFGEAFSV